jgi:DNA-binding transcriptional MerR regulator
LSDESFEIQELVELSGVQRRNIYFYVQQGLLPPPVGAGLAARYGREHLTRLRLIPLLRGQGLRLDQIRERFNAQTALELERLLVQHPPILPDPIAVRPARGRFYAGQICTRYDLPGGIVLIIPGGLRAEYQPLADRLLRAADGELNAHKDIKNLS